MQISKHFKLEDFMPPDIIRVYGQSAQWFIDPILVTLMDFVADHFSKPVTVNNWHTGGVLKYRGFRPPDYTGGGKLSQHRYGRAADFNVFGESIPDVYAEILKHEKLFMEHGLSTIEDIAHTPTWIHADIRWTGGEHILVVKP